MRTADEADQTRPPSRRRWPWVVAASVVVVAVVGAAGTAWLLQRRPPLQDGERYGIDVSHHQGVVDWEAVAADGIDFAYIKVSEGRDWTDRQGERNWHAAAAAGLDRGAYHFFTLCSPGAEQARHFLDSVPDRTEALPPVVDLEFGGNCSARPPVDHLRREVGAFVDIVEEETGQEVVLYVLDDLEAEYGILEAYDRPRWHRSILRRPGTDDWWIWQVTSRARVDGVDGGVDLNVMRPSP